MLIDAHAHVIPAVFPVGSDPDWPRMEVTDATDSRDLITRRMRFTARDVFYCGERRVEAMDASGVDAEIISPMPPLLDYGLPAKSYRDLGRWINEWISGLCEANPARTFGLGTVPLTDPDLAAAELTEVRSLGLHGIEIGSNAAGVSLGDERYLGFFKEAERLGMPIFVHALDPTHGDRLPAAAFATYGFAAEIGLAAASLVSGGTAAACPDLRISFSHAAGGFPLMLTRDQFFWGRTWNEEPSEHAGAGLSPAELARRFYYDLMIFDARAMRYLVEMMGPERLLVGSDFPAIPREQPAGRTLRTLDLPPETLEMITWRNGFRFLGVPAPA